MFGACCDVSPVLAMLWVRQELLFACCFEGILIGRIHDIHSLVWIDRYIWVGFIYWHAISTPQYCKF